MNFIREIDILEREPIISINDLALYKHCLLVATLNSKVYIVNH